MDRYSNRLRMTKKNITLNNETAIIKRMKMINFWYDIFGFESYFSASRSITINATNRRKIWRWWFGSVKCNRLECETEILFFERDEKKKRWKHRPKKNARNIFRSKKDKEEGVWTREREKKNNVKRIICNVFRWSAFFHPFHSFLCSSVVGFLSSSSHVCYFCRVFIKSTVRW